MVTHDQPTRLVRSTHLVSQASTVTAPAGRIEKVSNTPVATRVTHPNQVFFLGARVVINEVTRLYGFQRPGNAADVMNPLLPLVVGVHDGTDIAQIRDGLLAKNRTPSAVLPWRMPEVLFPQILSFNIPILMSPTAEDILAAVNDGQDNCDREEQRKLAARLAIHESVFEKSAPKAPETDEDQE